MEESNLQAVFSGQIDRNSVKSLFVSCVAPETATTEADYPGRSESEVRNHINEVPLSRVT